MRNCFVSIFVLAAMVVGCSRGPVVSVRNRSSFTISNAVVSGPRFTNALGTLLPGEERSLVVHPRGESNVRLQFESGGRQIDSGGLEYFEESSVYRVALTVTTNLHVEAASTIKKY